MLDRPQRRIRFAECTVRDIDERTETRVSLVDGDTPFEGIVERASEEHRIGWAAAEATVDALCQAYGLEADVLRLKDVVAVDIGGHPAVATSINTTVRGEEKNLFGLSQIVDHEGQAAALAVLGATNRFFGNG